MCMWICIYIYNLLWIPHDLALGLDKHFVNPYANSPSLISIKLPYGRSQPEKNFLATK